MSADIEIRICVDCLDFVANGDTSGMDEVTEARVRAQAGIEPGWIVAPGDSEQDESFSRSRCDACLSLLGGSRHQAFTFQIHPRPDWV